MRVEQTSPARGLWTWCLGIMTLVFCVSLGPNQALAAPTITSPTPGTTLPPGGTFFRWEAGGSNVTEWWIYVGTSPGAADIYDSLSLGTRISDTVNGLPTDGSTVHVRLWYRINGAWPFTDFTYTAFTTPNRLSALPPWDQDLPSAERYVLVMGGAAALDKNTGLVWERAPSRVLFTWGQAHEHCMKQPTGGAWGWRLPSVYELLSVQDGTGLRSVPNFIFNEIELRDFYWSTTVDPVNPGDALSVEFFRTSEPQVLLSRNKVSAFPAWCVRGPM